MSPTLLKTSRCMVTAQKKLVLGLLSLQMQCTRIILMLRAYMYMYMYVKASDAKPVPRNLFNLEMYIVHVSPFHTMTISVCAFGSSFNLWTGPVVCKGLMLAWLIACDSNKWIKMTCCSTASYNSLNSWILHCTCSFPTSTQISGYLHCNLAKHRKHVKKLEICKI